MTSQNHVLDVDKVAELLSCEPTTVQGQARRGELPELKLGRDWVFPFGALLQRLDEFALDGAAKRRQPVGPAAVAVPVAAGRAPRRAPPPLPRLDAGQKRGG